MDDDFIRKKERQIPVYQDTLARKIGKYLCFSAIMPEINTRR